jgi:hypothetical protein
MTGVLALALASDPRPDDNNVVAGWLGFAVLILLIVAVVFILRSFTKQLKKVDAADRAGVFDDQGKPGGSAADRSTDQPSGHHPG